MVVLFRLAEFVFEALQQISVCCGFFQVKKQVSKESKETWCARKLSDFSTKNDSID